MPAGTCQKRAVAYEAGGCSTPEPSSSEEELGQGTGSQEWQDKEKDDFARAQQCEEDEQEHQI